MESSAVRLARCPSCGAKVPEGARACPSCGGVLPRGADPDNYVGTVVAGKYRVEEMIGEGGMGRVFRAKQLALDKHVVLKVLRQNLLSDERTVARFHREAKAASRLNHPNSISVSDFGQAEGGALYIVMEHVAGKDLHQILSTEWPLPEGRVVRIMGQVLSALADAHRAGIIHRDLKPENIMVEPRRGEETDFVKVLDFGIAKIQDATGEDGKALTRAGFVCGTPEYMSPEQARGMGLDHRSDLYAVGVILYQLTAGVLPFEAESAVGFATKHLTELPRPPSQRRPNLRISSAMERLILRALSKSPTDRPQSADAFRAELLAVDRERLAEQAYRLGRYQPVLAPLPPKIAAAMDYSSSTTSSQELGAVGPNTADTPLDDKPLSTVSDPAVAGPLLADAPTEKQPRPRGASPAVTDEMPGSLRAWRMTAAGLVAATAVAAVLALVAGSGSSTQEPVSTKLVVSPVTAPPSRDEPVPLFEREIPQPWRSEQAAQSAARALEYVKQNRLSDARKWYEEAFAARPELTYSLALGALYHGDASLPRDRREREARGWWRRHLQDERDRGTSCGARASIVAAFPELADDEGAPALEPTGP